MSITLSFKPWPRLDAKFFNPAVDDYLKEVGEASLRVMRNGMRSSGRDSKPGQYPAVDSGRLIASADYTLGNDYVEVGTNTPYAPFLRFGTSEMAERSMSDEAIEAGASEVRMSAKNRFERYIGW